MTQEQKERVFRIALWAAGVLYAWGIAVIWMGPSWGLSGWTFYSLGVFPSLAAVVSLATALGLYMDLREGE